MDYLLSAESTITGTELHYDDNWVVYLHCKEEVESNTSKRATAENGTGTVLRVDLGVSILTVINRVRSGRAASSTTGGVNARTDVTHSNNAGRAGARQNIQSIGRKQEDLLKPMAHRISSELVAEARKRVYSHCVRGFIDIRERTDSPWGHKLAFDRPSEHSSTRLRNTASQSSRLILRTTLLLARSHTP